MPETEETSFWSDLKAVAKDDPLWIPYFLFLYAEFRLVSRIRGEDL